MNRYGAAAMVILVLAQPAFGEEGRREGDAYHYDGSGSRGPAGGSPLLDDFDDNDFDRPPQDEQLGEGRLPDDDDELSVPERDEDDPRGRFGREEDLDDDIEAPEDDPLDWQTERDAEGQPRDPGLIERALPGGSANQDLPDDAPAAPAEELNFSRF